MPNMSHDAWTLGCHLLHGEQGTLGVMQGAGGRIDVRSVPSAVGGERPIYIGLGGNDEVVLLDPRTQELALAPALPTDAVPLYAYPGAQRGDWWYVNDGDDAGNDAVVCNGAGSPVMYLRHGAGTGTLLKTLCVGRGHHVVVATGPTETDPALPRRVFVSDLLDGSITILGFDPADAANYLMPMSQINLFDAAKEEQGASGFPNNAYPHGMVFSPVTGQVYNLNNGYGTVVAMDPRTQTVVRQGVMKGSSNLLLSPCGRYLIGKGADRKKDAEHVLGRLIVMDAATLEVTADEVLRDFYPSTYRFNAEGTRLYVTSAATGKGAQKQNLSIDTVKVYDARALPRLELLREVRIGKADCSRRPMAFLAPDGETRYVFMPNPTDGTVTVLNGSDDSVAETVTVGAPGADEINFSYWGSAAHGC